MNKNDIFNSYTLKQDKIEVPSWGGEVTIQELSAGAVSKLQATEGDALKAAATIIVHGVVGEDGKKIFTPADIDKILDRISVTDLNMISEEILKLSDMFNAEEVEGEASEGEA